MAGGFDYFVILAGMRTGSNFLEENLNAVPGIRCWGEAFNPSFMGHAGRGDMAGMRLTERDADPLALLNVLRRRTDGLAGFRFFSDHDPRMLEHCLRDRRCAKVILTRNPLDSFLSLEIARRTGQWRLGDMTSARTARIRFDAAAFAAFLAERRAFQQGLGRGLQTSGQTAYRIGYGEIGDLEVLNGLLRHLGVKARLDALPQRIKKQNPTAAEDKVANVEEMRAALATLDAFGLEADAVLEPDRSANVPGFVAAAGAPILFLPIRCAPDARIRAWLAGLGSGGTETGMTQKDLRRWKRQRPSHRSLTAIRHPVPRIHRTFCRHVLEIGPDTYSGVREALRRNYGLPIPEAAPDGGYDIAAHRVAFLAFLDFVRGNLNRQTGLRVDGAWASQTACLQGIAAIAPPDLVLREEEVATELPRLADRLGVGGSPSLPPAAPDTPHPLDAVYDDEIEARVRGIYQRDYMTFGYGAWR